LKHAASRLAQLTVSFFCLLPVFAIAQAPQRTPATAEPSATSSQAAPAAPRQRRPPMDARAQEADLGLTDPANPNLPSLILVGDSTVRNGHGKGSDGLWGWGAPVADLFDPAKVNVVNRAIGGLSSHTYISQGHWADTLELIKPGDFVLIQFGHNDGGLNLPGAPPIPDQGFPPGAAPSAPPAGLRGPNSRGSLPGVGEETLEVENQFTHQTELVHTFGWYLRKYVADVRAKGATPILCSLVPRKIWVDGHIRRNTDTYRHADAVHNRMVLTIAGTPGPVAESVFRAVARAAALIDLNTHRGVHPRIGATDVVPFVPLGSTNMQVCVELALRVDQAQDAVHRRLRDHGWKPAALCRARTRRPRKSK